jgi:hypothetical protein
MATRIFRRILGELEAEGFSRRGLFVAGNFTFMQPNYGAMNPTVSKWRAARICLSVMSTIFVGGHTQKGAQVFGLRFDRRIR